MILNTFNVVCQRTLWACWKEKRKKSNDWHTRPLSSLDAMPLLYGTVEGRIDTNGFCYFTDKSLCIQLYLVFIQPLSYARQWLCWKITWKSYYCKAKFHYFPILSLLIAKTKQKGGFWQCPLQPNSLVKSDLYGIPFLSQMVWEKVYRLYDIPLSSLFGPIQQYMHGTPLCIVCCIWYASPMHDTGTWHTCFLPLKNLCCAATCY